MLRSWTESEKQRRARRQGEPATPDPLYLLEGHTPGPSGWVGRAAAGPTTPRKPTVPPAREALGPEKPPLGRVARKGRAGASSPLPGPPTPSLRAEHADRPSSPDCSLARPLSRQVETQVWEREVGRRSGREQARRGRCCRLTAQTGEAGPQGGGERPSICRPSGTLQLWRGLSKPHCSCPAAAQHSAGAGAALGTPPSPAGEQQRRAGGVSYLRGVQRLCLKQESQNKCRVFPPSPPGARPLPAVVGLF